MKKKILGIFVGMLLITTVFIMMNTSVRGAEIVVGSGHDYSTIQAAIDAANTGDTIYVQPGEYVENVVITKQINLIGSDSSNTIINGANSEYVIDIKANRVNISGFTIKNSSTISGDWEYMPGGINLNSYGYCRIENNTISNNKVGIRIYYSDYNIIKNNNILSNEYGIFIYATHFVVGGFNIIEDNTISNNSYGIYSYFHVKRNTISGNTITNNINAIYLDMESEMNTITDNNISNNSNGIGVVRSSSNNITNNIIASNVVGIGFSSSNSNTIYNNYFNNSRNAFDNSKNIWNIDKKLGTNIVGGPYLGGNYWNDYKGKDNNGDGLGDTDTPYTSDNHIDYGGDYHPLATIYETPDSQEEDGEVHHNGKTNDTPGFELILLIWAISIILLLKRKK